MGRRGRSFQVIDRDTGRLLALKVFAPKPWADYGELLARFRREVGLNSLGVIAFEALTGHPPFLADNAVALALKHVSERVPDDLSLVPDLPATVRETVLRALGKRPVDRFRTALAFADALSVADP